MACTRPFFWFRASVHAHACTCMHANALHNMHACDNTRLYRAKQKGQSTEYRAALSLVEQQRGMQWMPVKNVDIILLFVRVYYACMVIVCIPWYAFLFCVRSNAESKCYRYESNVRFYLFCRKCYSYESYHRSRGIGHRPGTLSPTRQTGLLFYRDHVTVVTANNHGLVNQCTIVMSYPWATWYNIIMRKMRQKQHKTGIISVSSCTMLVIMFSTIKVQIQRDRWCRADLLLIIVEPSSRFDELVRWCSILLLLLCCAMPFSRPDFSF